MTIYRLFTDSLKGRQGRYTTAGCVRHFRRELSRNLLADGVRRQMARACDLTTSVPSVNCAPRTTFGNWLWPWRRRLPYLGGLGELEDHGERGLVWETSLGMHRAVADTPTMPYPPCRPWLSGVTRGSEPVVEQRTGVPRPARPRGGACCCLAQRIKLRPCRGWKGTREQ